jgi:hypothetical protein
MLTGSRGRAPPAIGSTGQLRVCSAVANVGQDRSAEVRSPRTDHRANFFPRKTECRYSSTRPKSRRNNRFYRSIPGMRPPFRIIRNATGFQDRNVCFSRQVDQRQHAVRSSQLAPRSSSSDTASVEASCNAAIAKKFLTDILANGPMVPLAPRANYCAFRFLRPPSRPKPPGMVNRRLCLARRTLAGGKRHTVSPDGDRRNGVGLTAKAYLRANALMPERVPH